MIYVTVKKFSEMTGYTSKAIYNKIDRGIWKQDSQWKRAPDGRVLIIPPGVESWVNREDA